MLVIDDEIQIRRFLKVGLESQGFTFCEAATGEDGLQEIVSRKPDLVLLDLGLPGIKGIEVLRRMREWSSTPVIILSVQEDEEAKVEALDLGANDYLTKPFGINELLARIRAALRLHQRPADAKTAVSFGDIEIDFSAHTVKKAKKEVHLTSTEFRLIAFLVKNVGKVVTHRQIVKEVWGTTTENELAYLRIYIRNLRKKLEDDASHPTLIQTEPGIGYRLRDILDSE